MSSDGSTVERVARVEEQVDHIAQEQEAQREDLAEIKEGIHRLNGFQKFRKEHDEMWESHQTSSTVRDWAWEVIKVFSGGGVLAVIVTQVI